MRTRIALVFASFALLVVLAGSAAADLCQKCKGKMFITNIGKCPTCGGMTRSGAFKLCKACSAKAGKCQACLVLLKAAAPAKAAEEGFVAIFNGKDLTGWDGNPDFWSVKDGVIHGETTKEKPTRGNTFCIWRAGMLEDFELRLSFRIRNGNSGLQYRSVDLGNWRISGYQAEVCNGGSVGFLYHERGRGSLVRVGQKVVIDGEGKKQAVGKVGDPKAIFAKYKKQDWNDYRIIARGNKLVHYLNGMQTIELVDNQLDDPDAKKPNLRKGRLKGVLALQIHAGAPMVVEFKDIRLKAFPKGEPKK